MYLPYVRTFFDVGVLLAVFIADKWAFHPSIWKLEMHLSRTHVYDGIGCVEKWPPQDERDIIISAQVEDDKVYRYVLILDVHQDVLCNSLWCPC